MRRTLRALIVAGVVSFGLAGCAAPGADAPGQTEGTQQATDASSAAPTASEETTPAGDPAAEAEDLCRTSSDAGGDVCVLEGETAADDLTFSSFRIVKLIDSSFDGAVQVSGAEEVIVTGSTFGGDLALSPSRGAVVKLTEVDGTLSIDGARHATVVRNTVGGDLRCGDGVRADGDGNQVTGEVTGECARLR